MRVAILGAGMAGLSCAITLENHGVTPVVFENRGCIGDRFINGESLFHVINRPVKDCLPYLEELYQIRLRPISEVNRLVLHTQNALGTIDGPIGYLNIRGRHPNSFENQLADQLHTPIRFHATQSYEDVAKEFDRVVLATGDGAYASQLNNFRCDLTISVKGATVEGNFETDTPHVWFRGDILSKGYGWLIPFSSREANLVLLCPDYLEILSVDIELRWNRFFELAVSELHQDLRVTDEFQVRNYIIGRCEHPRVGNTYFTGNCLGALSPGLGFGQFTSVLSGIYAALDICGLGNYEDLTKPILENHEHSLTLRRALEHKSDKGFDRAVRGLNIRPLHALVSNACSRGRRLDVLKWMTPIFRIL